MDNQPNSPSDNQEPPPNGNSPLQQHRPQYNRHFDHKRGHEVVDYQPGNYHMGNAGSQFANQVPVPQEPQQQTDHSSHGHAQPNATHQQFNQINYYDQQQPVQERVIERVIERPAKPRRRLPIPNPFKLIMLPFKAVGFVQRVIAGGCTIIVVSIVLFVLFLIFRPVIIWNPVKMFLNEEIPITQEYKDLDKVYEDMNIEADTLLAAELDEEELAAIFKQLVPEETDVHIEVEQGVLRFMMNVEQPDQPLWFVADISQPSETGAVSINNVGFVRFGVPGGINSFAGDKIFDLVSLTKQQIAGNSSNRFFEFVLDDSRLRPGVKIKSATFLEDRVVLEFEEIVPTGF